MTRGDECHNMLDREGVEPQRVLLPYSLPISPIQKKAKENLRTEGTLGHLIERGKKTF